MKMLQFFNRRIDFPAEVFAVRREDDEGQGRRPGREEDRDEKPVHPAGVSSKRRE